MLDKKLILLLIAILLFTISLIVIINIKNHNIIPTKTTAYLTLAFILIVFLGLLVFGIYTKRGFIFNIGVFIGAILILYSIFRVIIISKK